MTIVLTIDPGKTTGYCIATIYPNKKTLLTVGEARMDHLRFYSWLVQVDPDVIVYEDFEYRPGHLVGLDISTKELVGLIKLYAQKEADDNAFGPIVKLYEQAPARKAAYPRSRLEDMGVWAKGREHGRDATRHFLYWWTFKQGVPLQTPDNREFELKVV